MKTGGVLKPGEQWSPWKTERTKMVTGRQMEMVGVGRGQESSPSITDYHEQKEYRYRYRYRIQEYKKQGRYAVENRGCSLRACGEVA